MSNRKKAVQKLAAYVETVGGQVAAAEILGCSNSYLSRLLAGQRTVEGISLAVAIEKHAGVPVEWWVRR